MRLLRRFLMWRQRRFEEKARDWFLNEVKIAFDGDREEADAR